MYQAKSISERIQYLNSRIHLTDTAEKTGKVIKVTGLIVESEGPEVSLGDVVRITSPRIASMDIPAEVVGFRDNRVLLMALEELQDIHPGCTTTLSSAQAKIPVGKNLLGRVIDGLGEPLDNQGPLRAEYVSDLQAKPPNPMKRLPIVEPFGTGVKAIDTFIPLGAGQRVGVFAGSGVGKSTLMGMIAREAEADVNVIALVGERGRELREFIEHDLGPKGLERSVLVVSTSDQPAPLRLRAAILATRIAEQFRDEGKKVLFLMDSVTRFAMAQREIGLAVGEPPTSRGYTPSVFSKLPQLLERTGAGETGSITALYTVLVEGDDMNEPIADAVRGILDGHIVLSRSLATSNHYPAIDVLDSVSRLTQRLLNPQEKKAMADSRDILATYRKNEDLISIGAYQEGTNAKVDRALKKQSELTAFLQQSAQVSVARAESLKLLQKIVS